MKYYTNKARQAGMTLIELTVVLLVLIGLAGLLMPYVGGFVTKTHDSTGASNIAEVNGAMLRYQASYQSYPDGLDSLVDADGAVYTKLMGPDCLAAVDFTADQGMALKMAGIDNVMEMDKTTSDATFSATSGVVTAIESMGTNTTKLAVLTKTMKCNDGGTMAVSNDNMTDIIIRTPNVDIYDYVVFGVGQDTSMVGKSLTTAPVHFAQSGNMGPTLKYNRFGVVFEVPKADVYTNDGYCTDTLTSDGTTTVVLEAKSACIDDGTAGTTALWTAGAGMQAQYAGSIMLMPMIEGLNAALKNHYDKAAEG